MHRGLISSRLRLAVVAGSLAGGPAMAAAKLDADQRQTLTEALAKLTEAHDAIRGMVSECDGGYVTVAQCSVPRRGASPTERCAVPVGSCELVAAMRESGAAIEDLRKTLGR